MTDIDVALQALRSDAGTWHSAGDQLSGPISAIGGLTLTGADVSMWAVDRGLDATYEQARHAMARQLTQAAENFHKIGQTLGAAADTYEREEQANVHMLNRTY